MIGNGNEPLLPADEEPLDPGGDEPLHLGENLWNRVEDWSPGHYEAMKHALARLRQDIAGATKEWLRESFEETYQQIVERMTRYENLNRNDAGHDD